MDGRRRVSRSQLEARALWELLGRFSKGLHTFGWELHAGKDLRGDRGGSGELGRGRRDRDDKRVSFEQGEVCARDLPAPGAKRKS